MVHHFLYQFRVVITQQGNVLKTRPVAQNPEKAEELEAEFRDWETGLSGPAWESWKRPKRKPGPKKAGRK